jgi:hypothetical protein
VHSKFECWRVLVLESVEGFFNFKKLSRAVSRLSEIYCNVLWVSSFSHSDQHQFLSLIPSVCVCGIYFSSLMSSFTALYWVAFWFTFEQLSSIKMNDFIFQLIDFSFLKTFPELNSENSLEIKSEQL